MNRRYTDEMIREMSNLYNGGMLLREIAEKYKGDRQVIAQRLKEYGVQIPRDKTLDIIGKKFGKLIIVSYDKLNDVYVARCECGNNNFTIKRGYASNLSRGKLASCGCSHHKRTHGLSYKSPVWNTWKNMHARCYNKNNKRYNNYGGRGIVICDEWKDFENFHNWAMANGYKKGLTIDRIDNDGSYCPENCRWGDRYTQQNNTSRNHFVTYKGETLTLAQWSRKLNVSYRLIEDRINKGWDIEKAFTTPSGYKGVK